MFIFITIVIIVKRADAIKSNRTHAYNKTFFERPSTYVYAHKNNNIIYYDRHVYNIIAYALSLRAEIVIIIYRVITNCYFN